MDIDDLIGELENSQAVMEICRENYRLIHRRIGRDLGRVLTGDFPDEEIEKEFVGRYLDCVQLFANQLRSLAMRVGDIWGEVEKAHLRVPGIVTARNLLIDLDKCLEFYLDQTTRLESELILYLEERGLCPPAD